MSAKKKILLITLSMLMHGAIMGMEEQIENYSAIDMASCISDFARKSDHDLKHMELLGRWLTAKRNVITQADEWNKIIKSLTTGVRFCRCDCLPNEMAAAVKDVVKETAQGLQPGQDCSQLLIDRSKEAIKTAELQWNNAKGNQSPLDRWISENNNNL